MGHLLLQCWAYMGMLSPSTTLSTFSPLLLSERKAAMFFARRDLQDQHWMVFVAWIHGNIRSWVIKLKPRWSEFRSGTCILLSVTTDYSETTLFPYTQPLAHSPHHTRFIFIFKSPSADFSISDLWRSWDTNHFLLVVCLDRQGHTG